MSIELRHSRGPVLYWLGSVVALVFLMVVVGGVTRLTGSGLSIVEWAPIMGAIPPLNETQWQQAFAQYQQYPQFRISNSHMDLAQFKGIFFWEYVHRLLGRAIGLVFLLPFLWFWTRGAFARPLVLKLIAALALGGMQGVMGWLMVKSGLVEEPRVSHYRLAAHLGLAFAIMAYILWLMLGLREDRPGNPDARSTVPRALLWLIVLVSVVQMVYGAFVAGLRAGIGYNTFPLMGDRWVAEAVMAMQPWWHNLSESHASVQFIHRWLGTLMLALVVWLWLRTRGAAADAAQRLAVRLLLVLVGLQYVLGVYTLVRVVPIPAAVMHQGCASLVALALVYLMYAFRRGAGRIAQP